MSAAEIARHLGVATSTLILAIEKMEDDMEWKWGHILRIKYWHLPL